MSIPGRVKCTRRVQKGEREGSTEQTARILEQLGHRVQRSGNKGACTYIITSLLIPILTDEETEVQASDKPKATQTVRGGARIQSKSIWTQTSCSLDHTCIPHCHQSFLRTSLLTRLSARHAFPVSPSWLSHHVPATTQSSSL